MQEVDIIILDLNGGDIAIHFVTSEFYNQFLWTQSEIEAFNEAKTNGEKWKVAYKRRDRISEISFYGDDENQLASGVLKVIYSQAWTDGEDVNEEFKIRRIMNLECS